MGGKEIQGLAFRRKGFQVSGVRCQGYRDFMAIFLENLKFT